MPIRAYLGQIGSSLGGFQNGPENDPESSIEGGKFEELDHVRYLSFPDVTLHRWNSASPTSRLPLRRATRIGCRSMSARPISTSSLCVSSRRRR